MQQRRPGLQATAQRARPTWLSWPKHPRPRLCVYPWQFLDPDTSVTLIEDNVWVFLDGSVDLVPLWEPRTSETF